MTEQIRAIRAGQVWTAEGFLSGRTVVLEAGKIAGLYEQRQVSLPEEAVLNAADAILIPGLIDIQVNGALGWSFQAAHRNHFDEIVQFHLQAGTTTLLPTLVTADAELLLESLTVLADYLDEAGPINLPGIHLEGPFLAPEKSGAHDPEALRNPDLALSRRFDEAAQGRLQIVTLAPELPGARPVIEYFAGRDVLVSAGHSAATYADMVDAIDAGLSLVTHAGNASDWPHRAPGELGFMASEPGVVGALLAEPALAGSVILDGYHFHPALLSPLVRLKGREQILLISDASTVAGSPPGDYESGGLRVTVHPEGFATSGRGGGWLAGSTITALAAVQRAVTLANLSLHEAVFLATLGPARKLGLEQRKGRIQAGWDADLVVLDPDLSLRHVIAAGQLVPLN